MVFFHFLIKEIITILHAIERQCHFKDDFIRKKCYKAKVIANLRKMQEKTISLGKRQN